MQYSYFGFLFVIFLISVFVDRFWTKTSHKYPLKLLIAVISIFGVFFFLDITAVLLGLWGYSGKGIMGVYFLSMPIEEYAFIFITPYSAIILWEAFHKTIRKR